MTSLKYSFLNGRNSDTSCCSLPESSKAVGNPDFMGQLLILILDTSTNATVESGRVGTSCYMCHRLTIFSFILVLFPTVWWGLGPLTTEQLSWVGGCVMGFTLYQDCLLRYDVLLVSQKMT